MPQTMLPGSLLAMTGQTADRLIQLDSGDAALLYLYLLRRGDLRGLSWPEARLRPALESLKKVGLAPAEEALPDPEPQETPPPEYSTADITDALEDGQSPFSALCDAVEHRLGKRLSASDLKSLYTLYDHLALPAERCV